MSATTATTTRRAFLVLAAGAGAIAAGVPRGWLRWGEAALPDRLAGLLRHPASAGVVGRAYLHGAPGERSAAAIVDAIAAGVSGGSAALQAASDDELRAVLGLRTRLDFAAGETVVLDGWILSRTEARVAALVALTRRSA